MSDSIHELCMQLLVFKPKIIIAQRQYVNHRDMALSNNASIYAIFSDVT